MTAGANSRIPKWITRPGPPLILAALALSASVTWLWTARSSRNRPAHVATAQHIDFNQDVQPILATRCFSCHGPDPEMRKAGLRLDLEEAAMRKRPGHPDAIVPGRPEQSELIRRIESKDPHHLMPQSSDGPARPMKPEEIAVLKEWITEGAVYRPHWAFEKPVRPAVPIVADGAGWKRTRSMRLCWRAWRKKACIVPTRPTRRR